MPESIDSSLIDATPSRCLWHYRLSIGVVVTSKGSIPFQSGELATSSIPELDFIDGSALFASLALVLDVVHEMQWEAIILVEEE